MILFFDTETTGLPLWREPSDHPNQPHIVEIAAELWDGDQQRATYSDIVNPGVPIPPEVSAIHGITDEVVQQYGVPKAEAVGNFLRLAEHATLIVGHNVSFDVRMMRIEAARVTGEKWEPTVETFCTMRHATPIVQVLHRNPRHSRDWKWPRLAECISHFFGETLEGAHSAAADVAACRRVFLELRRLQEAA